jgi:hypothetical protein
MVHSGETVGRVTTVAPERGGSAVKSGVSTRKKQVPSKLPTTPPPLHHVGNSRPLWHRHLRSRSIEIIQFGDGCWVGSRVVGGWVGGWVGVGVGGGGDLRYSYASIPPSPSIDM